MGLYGNLPKLFICLCQRRLQYFMAYKFTTVKRYKEVYSICLPIYCFTLHTLFLECQVNKKVLVLLMNIVLPLGIRKYWSFTNYSKKKRSGWSTIVVNGTRKYGMEISMRMNSFHSLYFVPEDRIKGDPARKPGTSIVKDSKWNVHFLFGDSF